MKTFTLIYCLYKKCLFLGSSTSCYTVSLQVLQNSIHILLVIHTIVREKLNATMWLEVTFEWWRRPFCSNHFFSFLLLFLGWLFPVGGLPRLHMSGFPVIPSMLRVSCSSDLFFVSSVVFLCK